MELPWPEPLVRRVRRLRNLCHFISTHHILGIPADLPLRFVILAGAYGLLYPRIGRRRAALVTVAVLLSKEIFDIIAVLNPLRPRPPDWGDLADILSGLAGIAFVEAARRIRAQRRSSDRGSSR